MCQRNTIQVVKIFQGQEPVRPTQSETSSENLKVVLATFLSAMAAIAAIQSSGRERPLPSTQPSPHTVAHCARLRICVSNPRWTGEVVRLATIA